MSFENFDSQIDEGPKLQDSIENQKNLDERVGEVKEEMAYATTLTKANDVLEVLELPDEQDDILRITLLKIDDVTLEKLSKKSKEEIQNFLFNQEEENQSIELKERTEKIDRIDTKLSIINTQLENINTVFTPEILANNDDISQLLKVANNPQIESNNLDEISLKEKIVDAKDTALKEITEILKNEPGKLESIINSIGGVGSENYTTFKETLISIDEASFGPIFQDLENIHTGKALSTNEIINSLEKDSGGIIDFDLKANPPVNKMPYLKDQYKLTGKDNTYVFLNQNDDHIYDIKRIRDTHWKKLLSKCDFKYRPIYHTRHTFATIMIENKEDILWVSNMLGHTDSTMTLQKYARYIKRSNRKRATF